MCPADLGQRWQIKKQKLTFKTKIKQVRISHKNPSWLIFVKEIERKYFQGD